MKYTVNLTNTYSNAYKKGFEDGKNEAYDLTLKICLETAAMLLVDAGWEQEDIQEFADRYSRGITYNCLHRDEWAELVEEARRSGKIDIILRKTDEGNN